MSDNVLIAQIRKNEGDEAADAAAKLYCDCRCAVCLSGGACCQDGPDNQSAVSLTSTEIEALLAVATLYVDSFAEDEAMSLPELQRLQEIEDILARHGRRY